MTVASSEELDGLWAVGRVVARTLDAMVQAARPGVSTADLDALAELLLARHGARSAPRLVYGFPGATCLSVNDEIVHGVPGGRRLAAGDLLKVDVTAEKGGFVADAARTVAVGEGASDVAQRLAACAREALGAALARLRPGVAVNEVGGTVARVVTRRGFSVVRSLAGHGVGRTIHEPPEVPNFRDRRNRAVLRRGMVLAVEPILAAGRGDAVVDPDGWTIRTRDGSLAAHHEETVVVTDGAPLVLTAA